MIVWFFMVVLNVMIGIMSVLVRFVSRLDKVSVRKVIFWMLMLMILVVYVFWVIVWRDWLNFVCMSISCRRMMRNNLILMMSRCCVFRVIGFRFNI